MAILILFKFLPPASTIRFHTQIFSICKPYTEARHFEMETTHRKTVTDFEHILAYIRFVSCSPYLRRARRTQKLAHADNSIDTEADKM